jgi:hypothetical protein
MGLEAFIPITLFLSVAAVFILRGPLGRALADRIGGRAPDAREVQDLRSEVEELRQQLGEVQERLDFAERLLAKQRERALPGPRG